MDEQSHCQTHDPAAALRERAIDLWIRGRKPTDICRQLGRSRTWFYNTLDRYRREGREGLRTRSRAPHHVHNRTPSEVEDAIVRLRKIILSGEDPELRYAGIGADTLAYELGQAGFTPPGRATINRVLRRRDLIPPQPHSKKQRKLPEDYPWPKVKAANELYLLDFVTRSIQGEGRFYGFNLLDQARRWPFLRAETPKSADMVGQFLVSAWQEAGLPGGLYIDNDVVWNGGSRGQRGLSTIVRLCLLLGIEVIFIPFYTPEANPIMESFNDYWNTNFWSRLRFRDLLHVQTELPFFEHYCRYRRPLPEFEGRTADQIAPDFVPVLLSPTFEQHRQRRLPITAGRVHFIRFVSSNGTFSILNERWPLDPEKWAGKTIRATMNTQAQQLCVYHQPQGNERCWLIAQFDYSLGEEVVPLVDEFQRQPPAFWPPIEESP
jgi:hypothetical protein